MGRVFSFLFVAVLAFFLYLGGRWYYFVEYGDSPSDPTGVALNRYVPDPVRAWGCRRISERFGATARPAGC